MNDTDLKKPATSHAAAIEKIACLAYERLPDHVFFGGKTPRDAIESIESFLAVVLPGLFRLELADSRRLDWLQENGAGVELFFRTNDPDGDRARNYWQVDTAGINTARDNIREAIDAAMASGITPQDIHETKPDEGYTS